MIVVDELTSEIKKLNDRPSTDSPCVFLVISRVPFKVCFDELVFKSDLPLSYKKAYCKLISALADIDFCFYN